MSSIFVASQIYGGIPFPHFGAIHSRRQNEISATVPTPPSQRTTNHRRRWASGRGFGLTSINDTRFQV